LIIIFKEVNKWQKKESWKKEEKKIVAHSIMEKLSFYSVKDKKKFTTDDYKIVTKKGRRFAVANHNGSECYRIIGKA
jgi:hypothetical protein